MCPNCRLIFDYVPVTPYTEGPITYQGYEPNCPRCGTSLRNVVEVERHINEAAEAIKKHDQQKIFSGLAASIAKQYNEQIKTGCKYCGADLRSERYLRPHLTGDCVKEPMLSAPGKHAATQTPVDWRKWLDSNYRELMLLAMMIELVLLAVLVVLEWRH